MKSVPAAATFILILVAAPANAHAQAAPARAASLGWMSGCWERRSPGRLVEETWTSPRGSILLGIARTTRGDELVDFEQMHIFARAGKLVFSARPSGQAPAEFTEVELRESLVVFENLTHDFPQRISYRRTTADSLVARIEGTTGGRPRAVTFPYKKVACG